MEDNFPPAFELLEAISEGNEAMFILSDGSKQSTANT